MKSSICKSSLAPRPKVRAAALLANAPSQGTAPMSNGEDPLRFPPLCDEAVLAVNDWLEQFLIDFQNHYFAQLRRAQYEAWPRHDAYSAESER
jgi:hypothetical protein